MSPNETCLANYALMFKARSRECTGLLLFFFSVNKWSVKRRPNDIWLQSIFFFIFFFFPQRDNQESLPEERAISI